ncbi:MAG: hypothetical protein JW749_11505 [Sedimentisphaerales bacterium]|nr:hypothetical protein [Sedimentisphaerales bacterium]
MTAEFYLFDVGVGQAAALKLPNGKWCMFDLGKSNTFSPVNWIVGRNRSYSILSSVLSGNNTPYPFRFFKTTISHYHGDHLGDAVALFQTGSEYLKFVEYDQLYLNDCYETCFYESKEIITTVVNHISRIYGTTPAYADYGQVTIGELCLPVTVARGIGGDANSRVNNASIVTRIDVYGNSILICGDVEKEAWEAVIADRGNYGNIWRPFLSNIDILVAPHHGHKSGYSIDLLNLAKPAIVLVSVQSRDTKVDTRYSQEPIRSITIGGESCSYISTRDKGHIKISIRPPTSILGKGDQYWSFGDSALP